MLGRSGNHLSRILIPSILLVLIAGLTLVAYLDYVNFRRAHTHQLISRFLVSAQDLRHFVESSLDFGLPLAQLTTLPAHLREMLSQDPGLLAVRIDHAAGQPLFSAGAITALRLAVPASASQPAADATYTFAEDPLYYRLAMPFRNSAGHFAGTLLLVYEGQRENAPVIAIRLDLVKNFLLVLALLVAGLGLSFAWRLRPLERDLRAIEGGLARAHRSLETARSAARFAAAPWPAELTAALARLNDSFGSASQAQLGRFSRGLLSTGVALVCGALLLFSLLNLHAFHQQFEHSLYRKAEVLGASVAQLLERLSRHTIEVPFWRGLDDYFEWFRIDHPDVSYVALVAPDGRLLAVAGQFPEAAHARLAAAPEGTEVRVAPRAQLEEHLDTYTLLGPPSAPLGYLHVGQERAYIDREFAEIRWDTITIMLITLLITFEALLFVLVLLVEAPISSIRHLVAKTSTGDLGFRIPMHHRHAIGRLGQALNRYLDLLRSRRAAPAATEEAPEDRLLLVRWPFFLFILAEALSVSFLPLYVRKLYTPIPGLSEELLLGLPISLFMLVWALSLPAAGVWSDRIGRRRAFLFGALTTAAGLALTATADSLWSLMLWRALTALGYGAVFITAQGYVVDCIPPTQRTRGMAVFLSVFFGGSLSGAAIGGILAERLGYGPLFVLAALLALLAALLAGRLLRAPAPVAAPARRPRWQDLKALLGNRHFLAITFLAAIPAKLILAGVLYYALPLYLATLALSSGDIGRAVMSYGLAMTLCSPLVGGLADRWGRRIALVIGGSLLTALAVLLLQLHAHPWVLVAAVLLLGMAQALVVAPQLTLILEFSQREVAHMGSGTLIGIFRLLERGGGVLGPLVVGLLIGLAGFAGAFTLLSLYLLASTVLLGWLWRSPRAMAS